MTRTQRFFSALLGALVCLPWPAQAQVAIPVDSPAFVFSPGNWTGDTGRGGGVYRQTWNAGAYFRVTWSTTSAHPTATLRLDVSTDAAGANPSPTLTYNVDGVWTDGVPCSSGSVGLAGLSGPGSHVLTVYVRNSPQAARWGSPGTSGMNVVRVTGLLLDGDSTPTTARRQTKWALEIGDSITEGILANNGSDDNLADYSYFVGQALQTQGYEYDISACGYSGWLRPGDGTGDVPGYYVVSGSSHGSGGTYDDAKSRWNKIDGNNHSLLDRRGHLSAYGGTGQEPSLITFNYGTNDALNHTDPSDTQASITQSLAALRRAAPDAAIFLIVPFGQFDADLLRAGLRAYRAARPSDTRVFLIDLGQPRRQRLGRQRLLGRASPKHPRPCRPRGSNTGGDGSPTESSTAHRPTSHSKIVMNLQNLALIKNSRSQRSSSWDRTGGNIDCVTDLAPGHSQSLLDTEGPGQVTHIWATMMEYAGHPTVFRDLVLRAYWDGASVPSVEAPLGDFFGLGHGLPPRFYAKQNTQIVATPITVGVNERSFNCYFPMPFHHSARIEIYNNGRRTLKQLYFHVDYELGEQPAGSGLFHALFRQEKDARSQEWINLSGKDNYVLMETEGRGHYVGCFYYVDSDPGGWWGEGDDMIFIDHAALPTINGTGTEDYFGNAWCYHQPFSYPHYGCPLLNKRPDGGGYTTAYRFHLADPIRFAEHLRVTMEHVWDSRCTNGLSSVAYWYQRQPVQRREPLPAGDANHPRSHPSEIADGEWANSEVDVPGLEVSLRESGYSVRTVATLGQQWLDGGALMVDTEGKGVEIAVPVVADGQYRVEVKPVYGLLRRPLRLGLRGKPTIEISPETLSRENDGAFVTLGNGDSEAGRIRLVAEGGPSVPLHRIRLTKLD